MVSPIVAGQLKILSKGITMKKVLVLGIGGSGCNVAELFSQTNKNNQNISFLGIDTDVESLSKVDGIKTLCLTDYSSLGKVVDTLNKDSVSEWFPCDDKDGKVNFFRAMEMGRGANGWRMKGLLSFEYMLSDDEKKKSLLESLDEFVAVKKDDANETCELQVVVVTSLCGGTGSALFLPLAIYIQKYIKTKYNKGVTFKALASCPDIYEGNLTSENKIKAYANAYATLREFNAVDLVSKGYNVQAKEESKCKVGFKIGSEKSKGIGVLFDSNNPDFYTRSAQPYDRLYLFDRIVGMPTIRSHEQIMVKALNLIIDEKPFDREDSVYAGISIAEVVFEYESIIDYVSRKKTFDDFENEWLWLYSITNETLSNPEHARVHGDKNPTYCFAQTFVDCYKNTLGVSKYSEYLALGREKPDSEDFLAETDVVTSEITDDQISDFVAEIWKTAFTLFENDSLKALNEELDTKNCKILPVKMFDSKAVKEQKSQAFYDKVEICNTQLADFHRFCIKKYKDVTEKVIQQLFNESGEFSIKHRLLTANGKYLHPVTSILALSAFYVHLVNSFKNSNANDKVFFETYEDKLLPKIVLKQIDFAKEVSAKEYGDLGFARLTEVLNFNATTINKNVIKSFGDVVNDIKTAKDKILNVFTLYVLKQVEEKLRALIEKYKKVFDILPAVLSDNKVDVKIALMDNTTSTCTKMNVGCGEDIKQKAYEKYVEAVKDDFTFDNVYGEVTADFINSDEDADLFKVLSAKRREFVCANEKMSAIYNTNIFRILHDRDIFATELPKISKYNDFKQALSLVALPLDISIKGDDTDSTIRTETVTLVPKGASDFARKMLGDDTLDEQTSVDKYLFTQGNIEAQTTVTDAIQSNKIFAVKKIFNFDLWLFNKINEKNESSNYYKNYKKALGVKVEQFTQMWNPHLCKDRLSGDYLPFINPEQQVIYEKGVYKAIMYMLDKGVLYVNPNEANNDAFYYNVEDDAVAVYYEGNHVLLKKTENLFGFARENAEFAIKYAELFDAELEKECSSLPLNGYDKVDLPLIRDSILKTDLVNMLTGDMYASVRSINAIKAKSLIDFVVEMADNEKLKFETVNFINVISDVINYTVKYRTSKNIDNEETLYAEVIAGIKEKYEKRAKQLGQRKYKEKAEKFFALIKKDN